MTNETIELPTGVLLRPATHDDAAGFLAAYQYNWSHLAPWEPHRDADFFTLDGQRARLTGLLAQRDDGRALPFVMIDGDRLVGSVTLGNIIMGHLRSTNIGYWIDQDYQGRGLTTAAVNALCQYAATALRLHRVEAGAALHNTPSQRVLTRCGFEPFGVAPRYLHINGEWRDHRLFQRILHDSAPGA